MAGFEESITVNLAKKKSIDDAFAEIPDTIDRYFGIAGVSGLHNSFAETFTINFVANKYITEEHLDKRIPDGGGIVFCTSSGGLGLEKPACRNEYIGLIDLKGRDATVDLRSWAPRGKDWGAGWGAGSAMHNSVIWGHGALQAGQAGARTR